MTAWNVAAYIDATSKSATPVSMDRPLPVTQGVPAVAGTMTATDKTVTSATGASQTLMAANAGRKALLIKSGNASTGINLLGGTAAIGGAGTITLGPLEGLYLEGAACPVGAVTAISTSTAYISAIEYA